ncbi:Oidioi.mRNA.OKI2018_I69.chr1.g1487.t1.cds [Oikopleura dioica]|uniref:Oidioi.mRNA.OKI2018_I69.chr1.g1487.t1.cds n=1 Tax=Oikopleura dioica TaxID=34765 RepID=A0ABN7SN23_OIKDI|nr:Oidioi.mRNA.OKI2018_I69.chr1.g1487.t1.cds [Oikopleura dioica]
MSNESHYAESESVLTEESEAPNSILIDQLRSKIEQESRKVNEKVQILQIKLSDAEIENANYKKRIAKLENTVHTQGHKIDQLETSLEEKILENEKQRLNVSSGSKIVNQAQKNPGTVVLQENFGLHEKQLEILQEYSCLGHFTEDDESEYQGGKFFFDHTSFALMMKAYKNGLKEFTLKLRGSDEDFSVGKSKFHFSNEEIDLPDGELKWCKRLSITHEGRKLRFKARIQVMNSVAGFEQKIYDWKETDSEGVHEQILLSTDWEVLGGTWYSRYHLTFLE